MPHSRLARTGRKNEDIKRRSREKVWFASGSDQRRLLPFRMTIRDRFVKTCQIFLNSSFW